MISKILGTRNEKQPFVHEGLTNANRFAILKTGVFDVVSIKICGTDRRCVMFCYKIA